MQKTLSLPPNVKGPAKGTLEFRLDGFRWKGNKTFPVLEAKIRFWGQVTAASIVYQASEPLAQRTLRYSIVTTPELFHSYLGNSNPVQVRLVSLKTAILVGASVVPVPQNLSEKHTETSPIFSPNGFILGTLITSFKITIPSDMVESTQKTEQRPKLSPPVITASKVRASTKEDNAGPNFSEFLINNVPSLSTIASSEEHPNIITETQKSLMLDYLTGKSIPTEMEDHILKDICTLSPAVSLMNIFKDLTDTSAKPSETRENKKQEHIKAITLNSSLFSRIDSIRFAVYGFIATKAGIKQIMKKINSSKVAEFNLAVECQICGIAWKPNQSSTMYFISKVLEPDDLIHKIDVNKQIYRALKDPQKFLNAGVFLTFLLWIRDAKSKISYILGASRIPIGQLLRDKLLTGGKIAIKAVNSETVVGVLNFEVELACRTMTFGSEQQLSQSETKSETNLNQNEQRAQLTNSHSAGTNRNNEEAKNLISVPKEDRSETEITVYSSLLYFGGFCTQMQHVQLQLSFFDLLSNEFVKVNSTGNAFNFLRVLPIQIDDEFLAKMKQNFILVEAYENTRLVASIKLPLHQFYIAFQESRIKNHLSNGKLPVISIDGWNNLLTAGELETYGQIQVLLAVGTELQIETLKIARGFGTRNNYNINLPKNAETQTTPKSSSTVPEKLMVPGKLTNFLASLANRQSQNIPNHSENSQQQRSTDHLLDMLNTALKSPDPLKSTFRVLIEIDRAQKLPKVSLTKKHITKNKGEMVSEVIPSTYVTFGAEDGPAEDRVKSHDGFVYTTQVCENSCEPIWSKRFEVEISRDVFYNPEHLFFLRVYRKCPTIESSKLIPTPLQDNVIGFTAINVKDLIRGHPCISNWFNIVGCNNESNGQIKVHVKLLNPTETSTHPPPQVEPEEEFDTALSRALKRQFTELEGISNRLKRRLRDVTSEDEVEDLDEEFERDLNSLIDEDDDGAIGGMEDYAWLGDLRDKSDSFENSHTKTTDLFKNLLEEIPATSAATVERSIQQVSTALRKASMVDESDERQNPEGEDKTETS